MYQRILVALDGSALAERVLPYVEALAREFASELLLLRATPTAGAVVAAISAGVDPETEPAVDPTPILEAEHQEADAYLQAVAERLEKGGFAVSREQPEAPAAEAILECSRSQAADLIAMTTHGRGGLGRLVFGSVADEVLRAAPCPVLLVRVDDEDDSG
jgi:nucleotide-binding universal stress UspA family protein